MTAAVLAHSAGKEFRALLPTWAACAVAVAAAGAVGMNMILPLALLAYALGSVALGAQSVGQEYGHRTLGLLLSQPASRPSLFLVKLGVLAAMLGTLAGIGWLALGSYDGGSGERELEASGLALILLTSLFVAPVLTMLTRSAVAGLVFTVAVPGLLVTLLTIVGIWRFGSASAGEIGAFRELMFWRGMFVIVAAAAAGSWWMFLRLEAIEGRRHDLHLARWLSRSGGRTAADAPMRRRHPIVQLLHKELHLQQMAFVVAGIFALVLGAVVVLRRYFDPAEAADAFVGTILYTATLPLLIGSMASAEERQFGTLQWQLLQPIAMWKQWIVKVAVAIALAVVLGAGLPILLTWGVSIPSVSHTWTLVVIALVLLTSLSLYVSSLNASGIRAMLMAVSVFAGSATLISLLGTAMVEAIQYWGLDVSLRTYRWRGLSASVWSLSLAASSTSALLLYFAYSNHRSGERPLVLVGRQIGWIAVLILLELSLLMLLVG